MLSYVIQTAVTVKRYLAWRENAVENAVVDRTWVRPFSRPFSLIFQIIFFMFFQTISTFFLWLLTLKNGS